MKLAVLGALVVVAACVTGIVLSLVLLDIPLNLFIAIPSAIVMGLFVFLLLLRPKETQFTVKEVVEWEQKK